MRRYGCHDDALLTTALESATRMPPVPRYTAATPSGTAPGARPYTGAKFTHCTSVMRAAARVVAHGSPLRMQARDTRRHPGTGRGALCTPLDAPGPIR